eukprot:366089-Chlamydomonas_euryale.AAC.4
MGDSATSQEQARPQVVCSTAGHVAKVTRIVQDMELVDEFTTERPPQPLTYLPCAYATHTAGTAVVCAVKSSPLDKAPVLPSPCKHPVCGPGQSTDADRLVASFSLPSCASGFRSRHPPRPPPPSPSPPPPPPPPGGLPPRSGVSCGGSSAEGRTPPPLPLFLQQTAAVPGSSLEGSPSGLQRRDTVGQRVAGRRAASTAGDDTAAVAAVAASNTAPADAAAACADCHVPRAARPAYGLGTARVRG